MTLHTDFKYFPYILNLCALVTLLCHSLSYEHWESEGYKGTDRLAPCSKTVICLTDKNLYITVV